MRLVRMSPHGLGGGSIRRLQDGQGAQAGRGAGLRGRGAVRAVAVVPPDQQRGPGIPPGLRCGVLARWPRGGRRPVHLLAPHRRDGQAQGSSARVVLRRRRPIPLRQRQLVDAGGHGRPARPRRLDGAVAAPGGPDGHRAGGPGAGCAANGRVVGLAGSDVAVDGPRVVRAAEPSAGDVQLRLSGGDVLAAVRRGHLAAGGGGGRGAAPGGQLPQLLAAGRGPDVRLRRRGRAAGGLEPVDRR